MYVLHVFAETWFYHTSYPKPIFGSVTFSQSSSMLTALRYDLQQHSTLSKMIKYLTSIWRRTTMVGVTFFLTVDNQIISLPCSELEPRRQRDDGVDLFVDLGATNEDHGEVM